MARLRPEPWLGAVLGLCASCGGEGGSDPYSAQGLTKCNGPLLGELNADEAYDGLELRTLCALAGVDTNRPTMLEQFGTSCAEDTCVDEVRAYENSLEGAPTPSTSGCADHTYLLVMRDGELVRIADDLAKLQAFLGSLDRPSEAALYARFAGIGCVGVRADSGKWQVVASQAISACELVYQDVLYSLSRDGELTLLARGDKHETGTCVGRRPLGLVAASGAAAAGVGGYFAVSAELEAASVVAFEDAEQSFSAHGAPAALLRRLRHARNDEIRHARAMTELAHRYGASPRPRWIRSHAIPNLEELACENVREGCVVETWGAAVGVFQSHHAHDPEVRRVMQRIASEEVRHAELSWDLQLWLESRLGPESRRRVHAERDAACAALARGLDGSTPAWASIAGLPSEAQRKALWAELAPRLWGRAQGPAPAYQA